MSLDQDTALEQDIPQAPMVLEPGWAQFIHERGWASGNLVHRHPCATVIWVRAQPTPLVDRPAMCGCQLIHEVHQESARFFLKRAGFIRRPSFAICRRPDAYFVCKCEGRFIE